MHAQLATMAGLSLDSCLPDADEDSCVVCLDEVREVLFLTCGHMVSLCSILHVIFRYANIKRWRPESLLWDVLHALTSLQAHPASCRSVTAPLRHIGRCSRASTCSLLKPDVATSA